MQSMTPPQTTPAMLPDIGRHPGKYLIFHLVLEQFGAEILRVREIIGLQEITIVPQAPAYIKGVINLRGKVIPVMDLRLKLGMAPQELTVRTCIVVMRNRQAGEDMMTGMIVDGVVEVLNLAATDIEDTPSFGSDAVTPYVAGMAKIDGNVKILLNMDQVLSTNEVKGTAALLQ